jgi:hypothetical protein
MVQNADRNDKHRKEAVFERAGVLFKQVACTRHHTPGLKERGSIHQRDQAMGNQSRLVSGERRRGVRIH